LDEITALRAYSSWDTISKLARLDGMIGNGVDPLTFFDRKLQRLFLIEAGAY
jgi:hypothetical protein